MKGRFKIQDKILKLHEFLAKDEELLRLLYYIAEDKHDDVLDSEKRPSIADCDELLPSGHPDKQSMNYYDIVDSVLRLNSVTEDLDANDPKNVLAIYIDAINPVTNSKGVNDSLLDVTINFDVYVHNDFQTTDNRMMKLIEKLYDILYYTRPIQILGKLRFDGGNTIGKDEGEFEGYTGHRMKMTYSTSAPARKNY